MALPQRPCATAALICGVCGIACPAPAAAPHETSQQPPGSARVATSRQQSNELEPIVVTARRRGEELQRTPVSVVSLNSAELEARSLTNLGALQNFVPNLTFAPSQNVGDAAGNIFIRGIGQEDFLAGAEPGVGLYLDGIYVARTMGTLMHLIDVDRIEVLRGPQGTLYGKNAIGGAINLISAAPRGDLEARAAVTAGSFDRFELRGTVNVPLAPTLFARLTGGRFSRDGYLKRLPPPFAPAAVTEVDRRAEGGEDSAAARLQLRWLASPSLTLDFAADASRRRGTQGATHLDAVDQRFGILPVVNALIREGRLPGPAITGALVSGDLLESFAGGGNSVAQDVTGVSASVVKDLGRHSIRLLTARRRLRSDVATDVDGTWFTILGNDFRERHRQFSAELQASGTAGRVTYTAGLFALRDRTRTSSGRGVGRLDVLYLCGCFYSPGNRPPLFAPVRELTGASHAAYAQGSVRLTDRLSATVGGRYSRERQSIDAAHVELHADTFEPTGVVLRTGANRGRWDSATWRAGLEYQAGPVVMLYWSAAKGYKSGGFNGRPVANLPNLGLNAYDPETAVTYEAGVRSSWFGRRLRLNATLFHTSYRDIQLRQQTFAGGVLTTLIENAARARIRGLEVDARARLSARLTAGLAYGHLDPRYLDVGRVPNLTLGTAFQRTPRHSLAASLDYRAPIGPYRLELHGDYSFRSREQFQLLPSDFDQPGYGLLGARLTLRGPGERWSAALFATNLADTRYRAAGRGTGLREVGIANSVIGPPRQLGVELRTGF